MDKESICSQIKKVIYSINVYQNDELVSQGSGVSINENGDILTAAHVIAGQLPVTKKNISNLKIYCKGSKGKFEEYMLVTCGFKLPFDFLKDPITIDLSVLKKIKQVSNIDYLKIDPSLPKVGQNVILTGFSDETYPIFGLEEKIDFDNPIFGGKLNQKQFGELYYKEIYKSGMVGLSMPINLTESSSGIKLNAFEVYIDNGMHSGASGGPIVNSDGYLIAIITQRALSSMSTSKHPGLKVPSGSTVGISASTLLEYTDKQRLKQGLSVPWYLK